MKQEQRAALAVSLIDLTLLNKAANETELALLLHKARAHSVAAICVLPEHLPHFSTLNTSKRATVVNFPHGRDPVKTTLTAIEELITTHQPDEMDYVFPYEAYLGGEQHYALDHCHQAYALCNSAEITFKVIIETGAFVDMEVIYRLSKELIQQGCDFIKTSTGNMTGASPSAVFSILKAIKESGILCGLKVSGSIKTPEQAYLYMQMTEETLNRSLDKSWFRLGASSLLDALLTDYKTHP